MPSRPWRVREASVVVVAVLALHGIGLGVVPVGLGESTPSEALPVLQTRQIVQQPAVPAAAPAPKSVPVVVASARTADAVVPPEPTATPAPEGTVALPDAAPPEEAAASAPAPAANVAAATSDLVAPVASASPPADPPANDPVPVYATRLAPPTTLDYELRRGLLSGTAILSWRPEGSSYAMTLQGTVFGIDAMSWQSRGHIDAAGIAPDRFTDRRRNRAEQAANFQRQAGKITYSGPAREYALVPGAQDRLSWMLQLPAILEAEPALREAGSRISMFVTGARGDADVWTFVVEGRETLHLPLGTVPDAIRLVRAPRKAYDTRAEAWLDPARAHLPVRARLTTPDSGDATDFLLR